MVQFKCFDIDEMPIQQSCFVHSYMMQFDLLLVRLKKFKQAIHNV